MKNLKIYLLLSGILSLTACSTMTQKECLVADWQDVGYADGAAGQTMTLFNERASDCIKYGIAANRDSYLQARKEGLKTYCTREKGYEQGANGRTYHGVCEGQAAKHFLSGYQKGKHIYNQKSKVSSIERDIRSVERKIDDQHKEQYRLENAVVSENDKSKRAILVLELNRISREINDLKTDRQDLLQQLQSAKSQLNALPK